MKPGWTKYPQQQLIHDTGFRGFESAVPADKICLGWYRQATDSLGARSREPMPVQSKRSAWW